MSESGRKIRSTEERVSEIDAKIEFHKDKIKLLEEKKKAILSPTRKQRKKRYELLQSLDSIHRKTTRQPSRLLHF